ncbi:BTAD domain-containing putative transcriptional regulator [Nocardioides speluncae]|uniref:BTAD domain-containing putative transcriptional regulator n=1 Tax=Nocardioides speluncae TaxID=2670337 RepID=UPI000D69621C|nr:BTAD domain-containing putative transcriptional regulator [Nocardioides speluncae]
MPPALTLLDGVRWHARPVVGERSQTLLAVLARHPRDGVSDDRLVDELWGEAPPANPTKALQVVVSRTRSATSAELVARTPHGYRLGTDAAEVDVLLLDQLVRRAQDALAHGDPTSARVSAQEAIDLTWGTTGDPEDGPLGELRARAARQAGAARQLLGAALSKAGEHEAALPLLEAATTERPTDEELLVALLRSEAAVRGAAAALERYEQYRVGLADRLGADPGPPLRRLHQELLAADRPVREGLHFEASSLLGRDDDVRALRALVHTNRVTSIVGAGGLGKTRLAHVVGREAEQPVVHFVELVGVTSPDDVVGEVGSVLGVRDSVAGHRVLTPAQRSDVRARIAQHLDQSPAMLILDNCEHVIDAAADLVAFLVATTRDLRVVTTSRAPLNLAAERVYLLGQLQTTDAVQLFRQRAVAARPGVTLDDAAVGDIVTRLDGLPLAIELAAAKVRVMSVEDIGRRLENRFALLRGGDRTAPDRHQTLLAVIDWSWNLLEEPQRRALRWLSIFHDGFTLDTAETVLGLDADPLGQVQALVDQSLLTVTEGRSGVRYRMLETVREFGRMQLVDAGEDAAALGAQTAWAVAYARHRAHRMYGADQVDLMDEVRVEETNLADVLRRVLAIPEPESAVALLGCLGSFWSISGQHERLIAVIDAVEDALRDWEPPADAVDDTRLALSIMLVNVMIASAMDAPAARTTLAALGPGDPGSAVAGIASIILALHGDHPENSIAKLEELSRHPDRQIASSAHQWLSHHLENSGDPAAAIESARRALELASDEDGPWGRAVIHTQLSSLYAQFGDLEVAGRHSREAIPLLDRLGAVDDAVQTRAALAMAEVARGRLDEANRILDECRVQTRHASLNASVVVQCSEAEVALAGGDVDGGLRIYREAVETMRTLVYPGVSIESGIAPWTLFGEANTLAAYTQYGTGQDGRDLYDALMGKLSGIFSDDFRFFDYPVSGVVLYSLGRWALRHGTLDPHDACRMLVLANRFAYNRYAPTVAWKHAVAAAEEVAPGLLADVEKEYGERRGSDVLEDVRALSDRLSG